MDAPVTPRCGARSRNSTLSRSLLGAFAHYQPSQCTSCTGGTVTSPKKNWPAAWNRPLSFFRETCPPIPVFPGSPVFLERLAQFFHQTWRGRPSGCGIDECQCHANANSISALRTLPPVLEDSLGDCPSGPYRIPDPLSFSERFVQFFMRLARTG